MVTFGHPAYGTVGDRAHDRGQLYCEAPQAEKLGAPVLGAQVADERAARRLRGTEAESSKIGSNPEKPWPRSNPCDQRSPNPEDKGETNGAHVPEAVLDVTEGEGAHCSGQVDHQDQSDRVLCREAERLLRVDGREDDHRLDAGLVENDAYQKPRKVPIAGRLAHRLREPRKGCPHDVFAAGGRRRPSALPKHEEGRQARRSEGRGGDQHRDGYELLCLLAVALSPGDVSQAKPEGQQSSQVAEAPAPSRHPSQRFARASSGRNAATRFSPAPKQKLEI